MNNKLIRLSVISFFIATSCASQKETTAVQTVEASKARMEASNKILEKASKNLKDFQKTLSEMDKDAQKSKDMQGKERFSQIMKELEPRLEKATLDLQQMQTANNTAWQVYKSKVEEADAQLQRSTFMERQERHAE